MKKITTNPFIIRVRDLYLDELGLGEKSRSTKRRWMANRSRPAVEARNALFNAIAPFCGRVQSGALFNKDHATVLHAIKNHEMYLAYSSHYGSCYEIATRIVAEVSKEMEVYPIGQYRHYVTSRSELETLQRTIDNIQNTLHNVRRRIDKNQNAVRGYRKILDRKEQ